MNDYQLKMNHISKHFPGVKALEDVSIKVKQGTVHAVMGENGAGKSTLMKILSGTYTLDSGTIEFEGKQVSIKNTSDAINLGISMIYQELNPLKDLTIAENIFLGRYPTKKSFVDWKKLYNDTSAILKEWGLPYNPRTVLRKCSVADTQMIEIIKAISTNAKLIIMDEPTSAIAGKEVSRLLDFIRKLRSKGITIIIITHRMEEVFEIADEVTVLRDGHYIDSLPIQDLTYEHLVELMVGRPMKNVYYKVSHVKDDTVLKVDGISHNRFPRNISFELKKGEVLGFGGMMGAGRTEIMRMIFGLDKMTSGTVSDENGQTLAIKSPTDAIKAGILMCTEDRKNSGLVLCRSVKENMFIPSASVSNKFFISSKKEEPIAEEMVKKLAIKTPKLSTLANSLSGGNQQKIVIAKWLLMNPKILILDEPTRGIDIGAKDEIYHIMSDLTEKGISILFISSDMPELIALSDRIAVVNNGRIAGILNKDEVTQEKIMFLAAEEVKDEE